MKNITKITRAVQTYFSSIKIFNQTRNFETVSFRDCSRAL